MHLNMVHGYYNHNGKIWIFWITDYACNIIEADEKHVTSEFKHVECTEKFIILFIYAKCKDHLIRPLWDRLLQFSNLDSPWCTIGDLMSLHPLNKRKEVIYIT